MLFLCFLGKTVNLIPSSLCWQAKHIEKGMGRDWARKRVFLLLLSCALRVDRTESWWWYYLVVHWEWTGPMISTGRELLSAQFGSVSAATSLDLQPVFLCHPWERGCSVVSLTAFGASGVDVSHVSCTAYIPLLHLVGLVS